MANNSWDLENIIIEIVRSSVLMIDTETFEKRKLSSIRMNHLMY